MGNAAGSRGPTPDGVVATDHAEDDKMRYFQTDAIGRTYKYNEHGNRNQKTPLHGSLRPPTIPLSEWQKISKRSKQGLHDKWVSTTEALPSKHSALLSAVRLRP